MEQIIKRDRHATEIDNNKVGILKGATEKLNQGIITKEQYDEIRMRVAYASDEEFYPVIYLINKKAVKKRLTVVSKSDAASDSSIEYIIKDLKRNEFDLVRVKDIIYGVVNPIED